MLLQKIKDVYRSLPSWMTALVKYIPDGMLFGAPFRRCVPRTDVECVGENLKVALDYARMHTAWGREKVTAQIAALELLVLFCAASPESVFANVMPILPHQTRTWARTFCGVARAEKMKLPSAGVIATNVLAQIRVSRSDLRTRCWIRHEGNSYFFTTPKELKV